MRTRIKEGNYKQKDVIEIKLQTRREEYNEISDAGPFIVIFVGVLILFKSEVLLLLGIIPGLIVIGIGIFWNNHLHNKRKRLQNEIKGLESELVV